jgi:hypothetical protein
VKVVCFVAALASNGTTGAAANATVRQEMLRFRQRIVNLHGASQRSNSAG